MSDQPLFPAPSAPAAPSPAPAADRPAYRVLARKYRPTNFAEMIGQDALVRTLTNALATGRLAHAFLLTGVRGVGKTTTARIIARALNCTGPDGTGGPTAAPCGVCESCRSILADRAVDVMEMDAASRTGVDDIREILDGVRYGPVACRYKVYIVDEVHMLSRNAFNALLKTLEEPPPHVTFIFATTEIRKVPVTVLSRCQRFDLRRVDTELLAGHFTRILAREGVTAEPEAVALVARAADGSVRDGLSLLDQAIAQGSGQDAGGGAQVTAAAVRTMLGAADRGLVFDILEALTEGDGPRLLDRLREARQAGADALALLGDLLDLVHLLSRAKLVPEILDDPALPEAERRRGGTLAGALGLPALTRAWQTLLKGTGEVQAAARPDQALEMVLIRLLCMADLPTPADLVRRLAAMGETASAPTTPVAAPAAQPDRSRQFHADGPGNGNSGGAARALAVAPRPAADAAPPDAPPDRRADPRSFEDLVALAYARDIVLYGHLFAAVRPVRFEPGRFEFEPTAEAPADLAQRLDRALRDWTGERWMISIGAAAGATTLAEARRDDRERLVEEVRASPIIRAVFDAFPGAVLRDIRNPLEDSPPDAPAVAAEPEAVPEEMPEDPYERDLYDDGPLDPP